MKRNLIILLATGFSYINAQVDSIKNNSKNITFSGIQLEMPGILTFNSPVTTREQLQKFVPNDPLLNVDLTGFAGYFSFLFGFVFDSALFTILSVINRMLQIECFLSLLAWTRRL